jgi:superfamily II DNA or RNA helicase
MQFSPGIKLRARELVWDVLAAEPAGDRTRLDLRCAEGDLAGLEWSLFHPDDPVEPLDTDPRAHAPVPLDTWRARLTALLLTEAPHAPLALAHPGALAIASYQREAMRRALALPRPRLLLADAVGLGKTIQAGLIIAALIARRHAHRVLIVTPSGPMRAQWARELRSRFGLRAETIADAAELRGLTQRGRLGDNPFELVPLCLTTLDFAKQDHVLATLERTSWDLVVIDEAHHCAGGTQPPTQRRVLAEILARRTEGLLLLTATPHDGDAARFASLMALLEPTLVDATGALAGRAYRRHIVRRLKSHLSDDRTGERLFQPRVIRPEPITLDPVADKAVLAFHRGLAALVLPERTARLGADLLAFVSLLKRASSTIAAARQTLLAVLARLSGAAEGGARRAARRRALPAYTRRVARYGVLDAAEAREVEALEQAAIAEALRADDALLAQLRDLIELAGPAMARDPKLRALLRTIRGIRSHTPDANVLVYTEYADSLAAAMAAITADALIQGTVLAISGADPEAARLAAVDRFATEDTLILLGTDTLAEGLNLHARCHHLIHLDLPYNPNRLEQRNGRIDRFGQTRPAVILYPYLADTFEAHVLLRLIVKYETARDALERMPDTLGLTADPDALAFGLLEGFAERQRGLFPDDPATDTLDRAAQVQGDPAFRALLSDTTEAYAEADRAAPRHGWSRSEETDDHSILTPWRSISPARFLCRAAMADGGMVEDAGDGLWRLTPPAHWRLATPPPFGPEARLGWSSTLVRKAVERMLLTPGEGPDRRVAVAAGPDAPALRLFVMASAEVRPGWPAWRRLYAVEQRPDAADRLLGDPWTWTFEAGADTGMGDTAWTRHFADWASARRQAALDLAGAVATAEHAAFQAERARVMAADREAALAWLEQSARLIAGPPTPAEDLFGARPDAPAWRTLIDPADRLLAYAACPAHPPEARQAARDAVALARERRDRPPLATAPMLTLVGLLMLVPSPARAEP